MDLAGEKKRLRERVGALRDAMTAQEHATASAMICDRLWQLCCNRARSGALRLASEEPTLGRAAVPPQSFALAAYMPHRSEADIAPLIDRLWRAGVPVALPKAEPRERQLRFYYARRTADLANGAYGIREPLPTLPEATDAELAALDVLLVPGLAFDESMRRLGYGGGYYDRLLARLAGLHSAASPTTQFGTPASSAAPATLPVEDAAQPAAAPQPGAPPAYAASESHRRPLLIAAAFELQLVDAVPTEPHDIPLDAIVTERRVILSRG